MKDVATIEFEPQDETRVFLAVIFVWMAAIAWWLLNLPFPYGMTGGLAATLVIMVLLIIFKEQVNKT